jgi:hypothetical protein
MMRFVGVGEARYSRQQLPTLFCTHSGDKSDSQQTAVDEKRLP